MIDLITIPASEAERIAYAEGFALAAELFKRIDDLQSERENDILIDQLHDLQLKGDYS